MNTVMRLASVVPPYLAPPAPLFIGFALGLILLVLLLIVACAAPFLLVLGAISHHAGRH